MSKKNIFKDDSPFIEPKVDSDGFTDPSKPVKEKSKGRFAFFKDERTHKVFGLLLLFLSIVFMVSFTSFVFTWKVDDDIFQRSWNEIFSSRDIHAENWLGRIGAVISHQFIKDWFGISSFLIVFLLFITGARIVLNTILMSLSKADRKSTRLNSSH